VLWTVLGVTNSLQAQVTTNGGSGLAATYPSLAAAITALNAATINSPVVISLTAGNPQTAPVGGYSITAQGTAINTITITGNNNTITAGLQVAGVRNDAIFKIIGGDYITLQNFTMVENAGNIVTTPVANNTMTEWGVALLYSTITNGAKNNTIQNNNISLNRTFSNSVGIYSNVRHLPTGTPLTLNDITNVSGSNSDNKVYGNTISNVACPVIFVGSGTSAAMDNGNEIGGNTPATGNIINNWGNNLANSVAVSVSGTIFGIYCNHQVGLKINYNTINSFNLATVSTTRAIFIEFSVGTPIGTFTHDILNNSITLVNTTSSPFEVIRTQGMGSVTTATININSNSLINCFAGGEFNGILTTTSSPGTLNINSNIIVGTSTNGSTQNSYGIRVGAAGTFANSININFNQLGNASGNFITFNVANSGNLNCISNEGGANTCALSISNNNIQGIVHSVQGSSVHTYISNTAATRSQTINQNTFTNLTVNTTGNVSFITNTSNVPATGFQNVVGNNIVTAFNKTGPGGNVYLFSSAATSAAGAIINQNDNNFSNITLTGATTMQGWLNSDGGTPTKTFNNNTFSNWTCGTASVIGMSINFGASGTITNNTITNISGSNAITGLICGVPTSMTISGNTIGSLSSNGGNPVIGMQITRPVANVFKNRIYDLSNSNAAGTVNGIHLNATTNTGTINLSNNRIGDLRTPAANTGNAVIGINITETTATSPINIYYNTIYLNASSSGANFGTSGIYHVTSGTATTAELNLRNNIIVNLSTPAGAGIVAAYRRSNATLTNYSSNSNNNLFYAGTPSGSRVIFYDGTTAQSTLAAFLTLVTPRETSSVTENPTFLSLVGSNPDFLKINPSNPTLIESRGVNIATFTDDFEGDVRQGNTGYSGSGTAPDIGADEFGAETIVTTSLSSNVVCAGSALDVNFTSTGVFNAGNIYTAQLSDASGSFAVPVNLAPALTSSSSGDLTISGVVVPAGTPAGNGYLIRVVSSNPVVVTDPGAGLAVTTPPAAQTLSPSSACDGTTPTFTATPGGSYLEFFLNGVSQGLPSSTATYTPSSALSTGDVVCVNSYAAPPFTFNGILDEAAWGNALATSAGGPASSGFGAGNNMDAIYLQGGSGYLYGGIAGNLVNGSGNKILLFIDCQTGGYNSLGSWVNRNNAPYYSIENLNSGITFDAGFAPDYILGINHSFGQAYFDLYNMAANSNNSIGVGGAGLFGFNANSGTGDYTHGFEFAIPRVALGNPTGTIRVFAMLVNDPGAVPATFLSNQFLTHAGPAAGNYGTGAINFGDPGNPDPIAYSVTSNSCFSQTCVTASANPVASATSNSPLCEGSTLNLSGGPGGMTTYSWTGPNGFTSSVQTPAGITNATPANNGVYTLTVTNAAGCSSSAITTVIVTAMPTAPTLIPDPVCSGTTPTFTAGNGSIYEFFLNGTSQGAASGTTTYTPGAALNAGDVVCVNSYSPFVFDGNFESDWGNPLATSAGGPASIAPFAPGNNMDALYLQSTPGFLFGGIAGNLVNGSNNRILLFIDCQPGGFNNLGGWTARNNAPYYSIENLSNGITFDNGFEPDYVLGINHAFSFAYYDLYNMVTNVNNYLGNSNTSTLLGYSGNTGYGDFSQGFEFAIPLSALGGPAGNIRVFAMVANDPGVGVPTTLSNQFLTHAGPAELNYGNGVVNFNSAIPDPISVSLLGSACFSQTCVTTLASLPVSVSIAASPAGTICTGTSVTFTAAPVNGGTTPAYQWQVNGVNAGANNPVFTPGTLVNGDVVSCILTSNETCTSGNPATASLTMTVDPTSVGGTIASSTTVCNGTNSGTLTLSGYTGSILRWEYSTDGGTNWIPVANTTNTLIYTNLSQNTIYRAVVQSGTCPSVVSATATITMAAPFNPGAHNVDPVTQCQGYNPAPLIFLTLPSGGLTPYSYQWQQNGTPIGGATSDNYDPPAIALPGTYIFNCMVTDFCGTSLPTPTKTIVIVPDPTVSVTGAVPVCLNVPLTLTAVIVDGVGTYNYSWRSGPAAIGPWTVIPGATFATYSPPTNVAGTVYYDVIISPASGSCNNATSPAVALVVNALPTASIINNSGTTILTCTTTSISVTASGGDTYSWDGGSTPSTAANTLNAPGTYTVTVTDVNGCTDTESIAITQDITNPVAGIDPPVTTVLTCAVTSISLSATGGGTYSWSDGTNIVGTNATLNVTLPGTYTVTVTAANGCTDTESMVITQDITPPTAGITNNTGTTVLNCTTTTISVTATGGGTYAWDGGATPTTAANTFNSPGTYTVTVTAANGCTDTESITITEDITPPTAGITNITGTTVLTCTTTSISVTATGGGTYAWDGGATPSTADNTFNSPGTYTVTVTAANGCIDTESIIITQDITPPTAGITNNSGTTVLNCTTTTISVTATGGGTYAWDGGETPTTAANTFNSPGTYTVTVTAANGCTDTESMVITQDITPPTAGITNNTGTTVLTCTTTTISVTATGGGTYAWDGGATPATADNTFNTPGIYTVTVTAANGCTDTESIIITQDITPPTAGITNNSGTTVLICTTTTISVTATGSGTYAWDGGATPSTADNTFNTPGTYTVTVTAANGCTDTESIIITQDITPPTAGINNNTGTTVITCSTTSISVTATGGVSYSWDGGATPATAANTFNTPGTYTVTVTAANGCTDTESITITQDITPPAAGITNNSGTTVITCSTTSINVTATGGVSYSWDGGATLATAANTFNAPGTYTVTVTAANGCTDTESIVITQDIALPTAGITNNTGTTTLTCSVNAISVTATGGISYLWNGGTTPTTALNTFTTPGTFTVTVTAANGCIDTESIIITQIFDYRVSVNSVANPVPTSYCTLGQAFQAINNGVYQGGITVRINGSTVEPSTAILNASGTGTANYTSVTIFPTSAGLSVTGDLNAPLIQYNGADAVTFDGRVNQAGVRDLIVTNLNTGNGANTSTFQFINSATGNRLQYLNIKGSSTSLSSGVIHFSSSAGGTGNDNNVIDNNTISGNGVNRPVNSIFAASTAFAQNNSGMTISNNNIYDFFNPGIASVGINIQNNTTTWNITANSFYETTGLITTANVDYTVIRIVTNPGNAFNITGNFIGGNAPSGAGTWNKTGMTNAFTGIYFALGAAQTSTVQGNFIRGFNWTNSLATTWTGIHLQTGIVLIGSNLNNPAQGNIIGSASGTGSIIISNGETVTNIDYQRAIYGIRAFNDSGTEVVIGNNTVASIGTGSASNIGHLFVGIYTGRTNTVTGSGRFTIRNNNIGNDTPHSISMGSSSTGEIANSATGIYNTAEGVVSIRANIIQHISSFGSYLNNLPVWSMVYGIQFEGTNGGGNVVSRNFVHSLYVSSNDYNSAVTGISVSTGSADFVNNIIRLGAEIPTRSYVSGFYRAGGGAGGNQNNNYYFNTVYIEGNVTATGGDPSPSDAILLQKNPAALINIIMRNNNFINVRTNIFTVNPRQNAVNIQTTTNAWVTANYNNYYVAGAGTSVGTLGTTAIGITYCPTLASWQATTGLDANSISTDPLFVNPTPVVATDFKPLADLFGQNGVGGADDFQYNGIRPAAPVPPTMGAWEMCKVIFTQQPLNDGGCQGDNAQFTIAAIGSGTLTYQWQVSTDNGGTWTNLANGGPYAGVLTNTLIITGITPAMNNYQYRCAVTSTLTVSPPAWTCTKTVNSLQGLLTVVTTPVTSVITHD